MVSVWSCPDCEGDLRDDLYAQFGLWCPECEQVIPWAALAAAADPPDPDPYWEAFSDGV